jgi:hypothetical protein
MVDLASNELFLKLFIWCLDGLDQFFKPIMDEFTSLLSSNEVVLIAELPCYFGVDDRIYLPHERAAVMRMEEHEYFWLFSITIEDEV